MNKKWQQLFESVKYINEKFGADILYDLKRLKGLLMDLAPDCDKEMNALLNILSEQVIVKALTQERQTDKEKIAEYIRDNFGFGEEWSSNLSQAAVFLAVRSDTEKTEEKPEKEKKVKVALKEFFQKAPVPATEEKPKEEKIEPRKTDILSDEWILSRADVMFQKLISHDEQAASYIDDVSSLIRADVVLSSVVSEIRKNYKDIYGIFESDFYLPGAMTAFLRKYSGINGKSEYYDLYQRYCDYMNSILEMKDNLPYSFISVSAPRNENYYFKEARHRYDGPSMFRDVEAYKRELAEMVEMNRNWFYTKTEEEKRKEERERKAAKERYERIINTPFRIIDVWSNPFTVFRGEEALFSLIPQKSEPETVHDRYLFLADKYLNQNDRFNLACYCLKKAKEINPSPDGEFDKLLDRAYSKCSGTDNFLAAWSALLNSFPENENVYLKYISFHGTRICDNIDEALKIYDKLYRKNRYKRNTGEWVLENLSEIVGKKTEEIFYSVEREINQKPEKMQSALNAEVSRQMNIINDRYNTVYSDIENDIREINAKNYWIPNKKCQYCGGEFKGAFKKICEKCGREKDYK